jgi:hypothetical protein
LARDSTYWLRYGTTTTFLIFTLLMFRAKGARVCGGDTLPIFTGLPHCSYRGGITRYGIIVNIGGRQSDRHTVLNFEVYRGSNRNHALAKFEAPASRCRLYRGKFAR